MKRVNLSTHVQGVHVVFFDDFYDDPLSPALQLDIQVKSRLDRTVLLQ